MFENKLINVPAIGDKVYASRIIASWFWHAATPYGAVATDDGDLEYAFEAWLRGLGISEEDQRFIMNFVSNGKLELEILVRTFEATHEVLDE